MKKDLFLKVWLALIILTIITAVVSNATLSFTHAAIFILGLSIVKFLGVSFYFMDIRKAHFFWKGSIVFFISIIAIITLFIIKY